MHGEIDYDNDEELERCFNEARQELIREFADHKRAASALWPLILEDVVRNLFTKPNHKFDKSQKQRLVWYYSDGPDRFVYRTISRHINQNKYVKQIIIDEYLGRYTYFRYYAATNDPKNLGYVHGEMEIFESGGIPRFNHWSHDHEKTGMPEHSGFVFQGGQHLFMLGSRENVLRMGIADIPNKALGSFMAGFVISLRSRRPNDPFSARFIMVHHRDQELIDQLSDEGPGTTDQKLTKGEEKFFELTQGKYAYFMLSLHDKRSDG